MSESAAVRPSTSAPWPTAVVDVRPVPDSARAEWLEARLRTVLEPMVRVQKLASAVQRAGGSMNYQVAALVGDAESGFGSVAVYFAAPPFTRGTPGCPPPDERTCRILDHPEGAVALADRSAPGADPAGLTISAERFNAESYLVASVRATDRADSTRAVFWHGGKPMGRVPLTADQVVDLVTRPEFRPS
ncbi:hypothetical protein M8C13_42165 [Crossiella sp. SN42]|uniref:hypothetical protein n=1 Tax=Crossiella sp. SN42 TaxID=2944808 RepID=UPI00207CD029|nr:hypothetical protein [Crossiella sp. SN42]MCO1582375.1 hypothetical protein [Crossiella sp. SN42]